MEYINLSRRNFIKICGIGTVALATFNPLETFAAESKYIKDYATQLELINRIRNFSEEVLKMDLGKYFYTDWELQEGMLYYLYISEPNHVKVPNGLKDFQYFGTNAQAAYKVSKDFEAKGYHTLVYKTAGTSATLLNTTLLSYPMESIAIIAFHEALHVHLRRTKHKLPIQIEEAASDVLSRYITPEFARHTPLVDNKSLNTLIKVNEKIYSSINKGLDKLTKNATNPQPAYVKCRKRIERALKKGNTYQKNRFDYTINNAYFVRNSYYAEHYFLLAKLYKAFKHPRAFIDFISKLPNNLDKSLNIIHKKVG